MKISIVSERVIPFSGGTETRWDEIGKRLTQRGHDVSFITGRGDITKNQPNPQLYPKFERHHNYKIKRLVDYKSGKIKEGTRSIENCINFGKIAGLYLKKYATNADVVDINVFPHLHLPILNLFKNHDFIITWHEVWGQEWRSRRSFGKLGREIELFNAQLGQRRIAVSKFTARRLAKLSKLNSSPIHYIPNGVSDDFFELSNHSCEDPRILFVGRLTPDKNVHNLLIPNFRQFRKQYPRAKLSIVGSGPLNNTILQLTENDRNITFHGKVAKNKLLELYEESNLFVLPSSREGSAIVAREANAVGIPVVTLNFPNNAAAFETVQNGINGVVTNPNNLLQGMINAYKNRDKLGKKAKNLSLKYNWDYIVDKIEQVYQVHADS